MNDTAPLNKDNIISAVSRVSLETKTSKAGNPYVDGKLHLLNGYVIRLGFIDENLQQAIRDSLALANKNGTNPIVPQDE